jgi:hypothetical protein
MFMNSASGKLCTAEANLQVLLLPGAEFGSIRFFVFTLLLY